MNLNDKVKKYIPIVQSVNTKNILIGLGVLIFIFSLPFILNREVKNEENTTKEALEKNSGVSKAFTGLFEKDEPIRTPKIDTNNVVLNEEKLQEDYMKQYGIDIHQEAIEEPDRTKELEYQKWLEEMKREEQLQMQRRHTDLRSLSQSSKKATTENNRVTFPEIAIPPLPEYPQEDNNYQKKKEEFLRASAIDEFVLQKPLTPALSPYEVKAGTILPLTLETGINSDIPGQITALIKNDVYDSKTGRTLLIPSGSRIIGKYSSNVSFGQERVQLVFNRITLPNQKSINIGAMIGVDQMGRSGAKDKVDAKLGKVFGSVVMSAILGAGTAITTENDNNDDWQSEAGRGAGEQILDVGSNYADKLLNVQPTLTIRPGYTLGLFVGQDLLLEPYQN